MNETLKTKTIQELITQYPFIEQFFDDNHLKIQGKEHFCFDDFLKSISEFEREDSAIDINRLNEDFYTYIDQMCEFLGLSEQQAVQSLSIFAGTDKSGNKENFTEIVLRSSEIISIVGPTGSGKSRLLADIEWTAQADTPTMRTILINGQKPDLHHRFSPRQKLVAQLSQNMNFVMDLSVGDFVRLHAESRNTQDIDAAIAQVLEAANKLAGEQFLHETAITALSGGQSRALMIADTAILSSSPIVLIDEIENAGIDRKKALDLLVSKDKIVLMATHDPALALLANRRLVIKNGGIAHVIETSPQEKIILDELEIIDNRISNLRKLLREGKQLIDV